MRHLNEVYAQPVSHIQPISNDSGGLHTTRRFMQVLLPNLINPQCKNEQSQTKNPAAAGLITLNSKLSSTSLPFLPAQSSKHMSFAVVRGTNKRTTFYVIKTELVTYFSILGKLIRMHKAVNR